VLIGVAALVVLAVVGSTSTSLWAVRRPLPTHSGELRVSKLDNEVTVLRDARGVPTITAMSAHDLFLAQGYTDAQDRFFLMDYRRHLASGTLAELVGNTNGAVESDMVVRTLGWRQVAEKEFTLLSPTTQDYLKAYSDGVNAYVVGRPTGEIAVEYTLLGLHRNVAAPAPWDPVDSLVWLKAIAWDLRGNDAGELARAQALVKLKDPETVAFLFPPHPADGEATISGAETPVAEPTGPVSVPGTTQALLAAGEALDAVPHPLGEGGGVGSNSWVVSGEHTASGKPLLAADPHTAISQPGVWSQVGLRCAQVSKQCPFDVSGFSTAGFPGVMIGHNGKLAWALSAMGADVTDLFAEDVVDDQVRIGPANTDRQPLAVRTETIKVAGGTAVKLTVRSTGHGPIVSDVLSTPAAERAAKHNYRVALGWSGLTPGLTADALFALSTASDADQVRAAAASFHAPAVNIVFATTDGHIGYQAAGRIPVRALVEADDETVPNPPADGTWPRAGWDPVYDWEGWVDPAELPGVLDPDEGFVVAANQPVGGTVTVYSEPADPDDDPVATVMSLSGDWDYGFRAQRIRQLLGEAIEAGPVDVADMQRIAMDKHSPAAEVLLPKLRKIELDDPWKAAGKDLLDGWDMQMDAGSPAAMYFAAVWKIVLAQTFSDELPAAADLTGDSRSVELIRLIIDDPQSPWWDDAATPRVTEGRDEVLAQAMVRARVELTAQIGSDPTTWRWGTMHQVAAVHPVLGDASWPVRKLVNVGTRGIGGGAVSIDATAWLPTDDAQPHGHPDNCYTVTTAPSMRMVVDMADLDSSTWVSFAGTSGHPASSHYADQLGAWADGQYFPWPFSAAAVRADSRDKLRLLP